MVFMMLAGGASRFSPLKSYVSLLTLSNLWHASRVYLTLHACNLACISGFFVNLSDPRLPVWLSSLHHLSFQGYTFGLYVRNALSVDEYEAFATTISRYSFSKLPTPVNVCVLGGVAATMRFLGFLVVLRSKALKFS